MLSPSLLPMSLNMIHNFRLPMTVDLSNIHGFNTIQRSQCIKQPQCQSQNKAIFFAILKTLLGLSILVVPLSRNLPAITPLQLLKLQMTYSNLKTSSTVIQSTKAEFTARLYLPNKLRNLHPELLPVELPFVNPPIFNHFQMNP